MATVGVNSHGDIGRLEAQINRLSERIDWISGMLPLTNFVQDYFQKLECESSVQLMRLKHANMLGRNVEDNVGGATALETAKWIHVVTDAVIQSKPQVQKDQNLGGSIRSSTATPAPHDGAGYSKANATQPSTPSRMVSVTPPVPSGGSTSEQHVAGSSKASTPSFGDAKPYQISQLPDADAQVRSVHGLHEVQVPSLASLHDWQAPSPPRALHNRQDMEDHQKTNELQNNFLLKHSDGVPFGQPTVTIVSESQDEMGCTPIIVPNVAREVGASRLPIRQNWDVKEVAPAKDLATLTRSTGHVGVHSNDRQWSTNQNEMSVSVAAHQLEPCAEPSIGSVGSSTGSGSSRGQATSLSVYDCRGEELKPLSNVTLVRLNRDGHEVPLKVRGQIVGLYWDQQSMGPRLDDRTEVQILVTYVEASERNVPLLYPSNLAINFGDTETPDSNIIKWKANLCKAGKKFGL